MADKKISGLTAGSAALAVGDLIPYVDVSDTADATTGTTKKLTPNQLAADPLLKIKSQGAPATQTTVITLTIADLLTGIIVSTPTAGATAYTLPSGALTDAGATFAVDSCIDWSIINLGADADDIITVTSPGADHTVIGQMAVASNHATTGLLYGNAAIFRTRKTAADTFITYRIA